MKRSVARFLVCWFLLAVLLVPGCGYEHHPVRVRAENPEALTPETFSTYALRVEPPWPDGGHVLLAFPEFIRSASASTTLFSSDDLAFILPCPTCSRATLFTAPVGSKTVRCATCDSEISVLPSYRRHNPWNVAPDERTARLDLDSPSVPGVHLTLDLKVTGPRLDFVLTLRNGTQRDFTGILTRFTCDYSGLTGFHAPSGDHDRCVIQEDRALAILADTAGSRRMLIHWNPGQQVQVNSDRAILEVDPLLGDLPAGASVQAIGTILFSREPKEDLLKEVLDTDR